MAKLTKILITALTTLALAACFGGSDSSSSGNGSSGSGGAGSGNGVGGGASGAYYKAFYDCSNAAEDAEEQALFTAICGQHTITFDNGDTGVMRIGGSLVNWTNIAGNWSSFVVQFYMNTDQDLHMVRPHPQASISTHPFLFETAYIDAEKGELTSADKATYKIIKCSDTSYDLDIDLKKQDPSNFSLYDVAIHLEITLDSQGKFKSLVGRLSNEYGEEANFTATGTPAKNNELEVH